MRLFLYVRLPASMPGLLSGLQLAAIHAPITTLASEWMGAQSGLGYLIMLAHGRLEMDFLFATLLVLITVTALFAKVMEKIQRKVLFWTW
jgi:putative hydroxymethylpyrimidine transport system permease protein